MPTPRKDETKDDFINRCMGDNEAVNDYPDESQRFAVCSSKWKEHFAQTKISFDYDGVLTTVNGTYLALSLVKNNELFIISARHSKDGLLNKADQIGIKHENVYATGSNNDKIRKIQELGIERHYDNNEKVIQKLGQKGELFKN